MSFLIIPRLQLQIGGELLDTSFKGYNISDVNPIMGKLGTNGRSTYLYLELLADLPYIIFYVITFIILIVRLLKKNKIKSEVVFFIALFPLFAGIFDFIEDISIINILVTYPEINSDIIDFSASATALKGYFLVFTFLSIVINLAFLLFKKIRHYA